MSTPLVTVIMLNWNGRHLLEGCLPSVFRQTFKDYEIILVDNGSTDGSVEWVRGEYPDVRVIPLHTNHGFCRGNNIGISLAQGEYVVLLNNDTEVESAWLEELCSHICGDGQVGACDSKVLFFDRRDTIWATGGTYSIAGTTSLRGHMERDDATFQRAEDVFVAGACAAIYRRKVLREVGLFDEDFFAGYEDVDWSFRAHLCGYRIVNVPRARVYHKVSATHKYNSDMFVYNGQRNVLSVFIKNMPSTLLRRYWPLHLVYSLASMVYFARIRRGRAFLRAKRDALRQLPLILRKRREIQVLRRVSAEKIDSLLSRDWFRPQLKKFRVARASCKGPALMKP
jgi:GT2 family glycosyltransferase